MGTKPNFVPMNSLWLALHIGTIYMGTKPNFVPMCSVKLALHIGTTFDLIDGEALRNFCFCPVICKNQ